MDIFSIFKRFSINMSTPCDSEFILLMYSSWMGGYLRLFENGFTIDKGILVCTAFVFRQEM